MDDFGQQRTLAARWIHDRKDRVDWWQWSVLTEHNPDAEGLKLSPKAAMLIFADLVHAGLLVPVVGSDGQEAYSVNPGKDHQWQEVMHPRWSLFRGRGLRVLEWVVSGVIGAAIAFGLAKLFGG